VLPIAIVSLLTSQGLLRPVLLSAPLVMLISLGVSSAGGAWWKKRPDSHDLVFSDLMIWGWLRRLRTERRLSRAVALLGTGREPSGGPQLKHFEALAHALEARDSYTYGHTRRVTRHSAAIAERMGLSRDEVAKVRTAAAIHDVGKLHTPRDVLNKPGRLTDEEFDVIKKHPVDGAEMAARLGDDEITAMVLHHHERLDGTGYPSGLAGEQIPLGARIIAVADTFDAITSRRAYRGASSHKKALGILTTEAGAQLDPEAVRAFSSHYSGMRGVALGSLLTSAPQRLLAFRWSGLSSAPIAKSLAALAVAGALGGSAAQLVKPSTNRGVRGAGFAQLGAGLAAQASSASSSPLFASSRAVNSQTGVVQVGPARGQSGGAAPRHGESKRSPSAAPSGSTGQGSSGAGAGGSTSSNGGAQSSGQPGPGGGGGATQPSSSGSSSSSSGTSSSPSGSTSSSPTSGTSSVTGAASGATNTATGVVSGVTNTATGVVTGATNTVTGVVTGVTKP
jgi:putative nucleotidyltransferase with HDIG domain